MPPQGNFYILGPQKWNFLDSEHKFPIMSVPKVIVTFQFYLYELMPSVVFYMYFPELKVMKCISVPTRLFLSQQTAVGNKFHFYTSAPAKEQLIICL